MKVDELVRDKFLVAISVVFSRFFWSRVKQLRKIVWDCRSLKGVSCTPLYWRRTCCLLRRVPRKAVADWRRSFAASESSLSFGSGWTGQQALQVPLGKKAPCFGKELDCPLATWRVGHMVRPPLASEKRCQWHNCRAPKHHDGGFIHGAT